MRVSPHSRFNLGPNILLLAMALILAGAVVVGVR